MRFEPEESKILLGGGVCMTKEEFLDIKNEISKFCFTSLLFTEYEEIANYEILCNNQNIIVLYGFHLEDKKYEFHWACSNPQTLLSNIKKRNENEQLTFVPKEWVEDFKVAGFEIRAIWNDYFATNLETYANYLAPILVNEVNCVEASEVTLSCYGQSRGFTGQSKEWMKQWINNLEPAVPGYARDCNVFADISSEMTGIVCVGIYGSEDKTTLWIREIAVKPEHSGRGIGRRLLGQAFAYGIMHGAKRAFLLADECNENALHLYKSMGFVSDSDECQIDMIRLPK